MFRKFLLFVLVFSLLPWHMSVGAVDTTPGTIVYQGRIINKGPAFPVINNYTVRFSFWKSSDWASSDKTDLGGINTGSENYGGWSELHIVIIGDNGSFMVQLGSREPLPNIDFETHKYLQVEIKISGKPDSTYQLLDPTGDNGADINDRQIIGSVMYAKNSERLASNKIGDGEGDIALLGEDGKWDIGMIPDGVGGGGGGGQDSGSTNEETFIIDKDDTVGETGAIKLQFGDALDKHIQYSADDSEFNINDSLNVEGGVEIDNDLVVTGITKALSDLEVSGSFKLGENLDKTILYNDFNTEFIFSDSTKVEGDLEVEGNTIITGQLTLNDTTDSIDKDSGAVILDGGIGIEKNLSLGGNIDFTTGDHIIGASLGVNDLTLGAIASTVVIPGDLDVQGTSTTYQAENVDVTDKEITVNVNGTTALTTGSGLLIEGDGGTTVGYMRVDGADTGLWEVKSPTGNELVFDVNADSTLTINSSAVLDQNVDTLSSPDFAGLTVDSDTFYVDSSNDKVGIGTASPSEKLEVSGNGKVDGELEVTGIIKMTPQGEEPTCDASVEGGTYYNSTTDHAYLCDGSAWRQVDVDAGGGGGGDFSDGGDTSVADRSLGNQSNFDFSFLTNNQDRLHIEAGGNIGIGTADPSALLEVSGNAKVDGDLDITGNITNATVDGDNVTFQDIPFSALSTREKYIFISPSESTIIEDGTSNSVSIDSNISDEDNLYYLVKSLQSSLQDIHLLYKVNIPKDFESFTNMSFDYKNTGDESGSGIDLYVMDKDGDFAFSPTSIFNTDWTEFTDPLDDASFDPAAGEYVLIYVHAFASGNGSKSTYAGEITLTYQGR